MTWVKGLMIWNLSHYLTCGDWCPQINVLLRPDYTFKHCTLSLGMTETDPMGRVYFFHLFLCSSEWKFWYKDDNGYIEMTLLNFASVGIVEAKLVQQMSMCLNGFCSNTFIN